MLRNLRLLLGGTYHNFEGFAGAVRPLFEAEGYAVEATYELTALERNFFTGPKTNLANDNSPKF